MTVLTITTLTEVIPEGTTEVKAKKNYSSKIPNIPSTVKKLKLGYCINLTTLPDLPEGLEEIDLFSCSALKTIKNIPSTVKKLNLQQCINLKTLPKLPEGLEEINLSGCSTLETINNIPSTVKKLDLGYCINLTTLPQLHEGLEEIDLSGFRALETIPNIPSTIKKLNLGHCRNLKTLPELPEGLEEIDLCDCIALKTINNIPSTVKKLDLQHCENLKTLPELPKGLEDINLFGCSVLILTADLILELETLEQGGCVIQYPAHFNQEELTKRITDKFNSLAESYKSTNPEQRFVNSETLIHRFLTEGVGQRSDKTTRRGRLKDISQSILPVLEVLEKNPHLLPIVEEVSSISLGGCVNQPVRTRPKSLTY